LQSYGLFFRGSNWRLFAKSNVSDQDWLQFKVLDFKNIKLTETAFEPPPNFNLDQEIKRMWQSFNGEQVEVKVRILPTHAFLAEEKLKYPSQQIIERKANGAAISIKGHFHLNYKLPNYI